MVLIGTVSYGACALAFLALAVVLMLRLPQTLAVRLLVVAAGASAVWAAVMLAALHTTWVPAYAGELAEWLRSGAWLLFLSHLIGADARSVWPAVLRRGIWVVLGLALASIVVDVLIRGQPALIMGVGVGFVYASLPMILLGLLLLEQVYRGLASERRWAMKHLCLGVGVIWVYDFYLYADALLFQTLDPQLWLSRGMVNAVAVPLIAVTVARNRSWATAVFVSRHVAFHTTTLLAAGVYLMLMAAGGYYIRDFGGDWGSFFQIVFIVVAVVTLAVVLLSGDARSRLRVFLSKHFFSNKYDYREEWLALIQRLSDDNDGLSPPQRAVHAVAQIFECPAGGVWWRRDGERFQPSGQWRMALPEGADLPAGDALVRFLAERRWVVELAEYRAAPERYGTMALPAWFAELDRPWVVVPLLHGDELLGFIVLARPNVPTPITWEDRDLLKTLGYQAAIYLSQHENAQALSQARQFEAFNRLTAFLMHDLKNLIAQQSLVVKNAEKHKHNPAFVDDAMMTIGNSVTRMERVLEHLQRGRSYGEVERVNLVAAVAEICQRCSDRAPAPVVDSRVEEAWVELEPQGLAMVLTHIVRNAQDATTADGRVAVTLAAADGRASLEIVDDGEGMDETFIRERLFRPFDSTKSSKGMGIGAHQAREFFQAAGGAVEVTSTPGRGTRFLITLPLGQQAGSVGEARSTGMGG